jgi:hypothetical protein
MLQHENELDDDQWIYKIYIFIYISIYRESFIYTYKYVCVCICIQHECVFYVKQNVIRPKCDILTFATHWMRLEDIKLTEISFTQKTQYYMFSPLICLES